MDKPVHILIVEDLKTDFELAQREIRKSMKDCEFKQVETRKDFLNTLKTFQPDVILSDYSLPRFDGMTALKLTLELAPLTPFIIWTGSLSEDVAVECMKAGANNYILKENIKRLGPAIVHAVEEGQLLSERALADKKLQESEKRFRSLIENGLDSISLLAKDGTLLWENPAVNRNLGYKQDEFVGRNIFELMHPEDIDWTTNTFKRLHKNPRKQEHGIFRLRHQDGTWRWIEAVATNLLNEPSVGAIVVNYRDITKRKQAEIELKQRNDDLALINALNEVVNQGEGLDVVMNTLAKEMQQTFSSEASSIFMLSSDRRFLTMQQFFISPKLMKKIENLIGSTIPLVKIPVREGGYLHGVLYAKRGIIMSNPKEIQKWLAEFIETPSLPTAAKGTAHKLVPQIYKLMNIKSLTIVPLVSSGGASGLVIISSPNLFTDGDLKRIENIGRQLTATIQHQQASEEIQKSEKFLQGIQNSFSENIAILNKEGIVVQVNSAWRKFGELNGLTHSEFGIGLNYLNVCDSATGTNAEEASSVANAIREVIAGQRREALIEYPCHSPKERRWFVLHITRFENSGETWVVLAHENITERKQVEEALREASEEFRTLFEASPDAIFLFDPHNNWSVLDCNAAACSMNGYAREELIGQSVQILDAVPGTPDGYEKFPERIRKAGVLHFESFHRHKNGTVFPIEVSSSIISLGGRDVVLGIDRDITERKQAEEALRQSENRYRTVVENQTEFIVRWNNNGVRTFVNDAYCRHFGITQEQALATSFMPLIHEEDRPAVEEKLSRLLSGKVKVETDIHRVIDPDGSIGWQEWTDQAIYDKSGHLIEFQSVGRDITERKKTEEMLRARDELLSESQKISQLGHYDLDITTGIWKSSDILDEVFGIDDDYIKDVEGWANLIHPAQREEMVNYFTQHVLGEHNTFDREYRIVRKSDRQERWVHGMGRLEFDDDNNPIRMIGTIQDITERKLAEKHLRESEQRYRGLFENLVIGFALHEIVTNYDGKPVDYVFLEINPMFEQLTGINANQAVGRRVTEVLPGIENERFIQIYGKVALTGEPVHFEEYSIPLDKYYEINAYSPARGQFAVTFTDITKRKQAGEQLRKLSRAVEQSASAIVITDIVGNIEYVNPKFTETSGYTFSEVVGENPRILKSNHTPPKVYEDLWKTITSGEDWHGELYNKKKNGDFYWEQVTISPIINEHKEITHFIAVKEEITERKQAEKEIQRHLAELEALYETGLAVGRLLELHKIGERMIDTFNRYLSWHHVTIRLLKTGSDELELVAFSIPHIEENEKDQIAKNFARHISKVGQGMSGWVIQTGKPVRTGNVRSFPQYVEIYEGIQSGLYMPLMIGEDVIGVISVESEKTDAFSPQDERLLATLANQAAVAFENARLYQSAQQEIAERKRTQEALLTSETHYRELSDSITDVFFELDRELHYTHWNKASEILTGVPAKDALGKSIQEIFGTSKGQTRIEEIYREVLEKQVSRVFESTLIVGNTHRYFEINAYPSTRGVAVVAKDVTDRKQSESIMQKRFELMEFSVNHSLQELMQKTLDEISDWTDSTVGFFQFVDEDQVTPTLQVGSINTFQPFHNTEKETLHKPAEQARAWDEAIRQRRSIIHNDSESLPDRKRLSEGGAALIRELVVPIIRSERILAVIGVGNKPHEYTRDDLEIAERFVDYAWDIIERKKMENALAEERNQLAKRVDERTADLSRANSNLARALRVKDEFLANMSHELRTPLNAILGLSESLAEQIAGPLNEKQERYISTISESGHHLLSLINDILDLAKIEAGQITLDINKVNVHSVAEASLRMIKQMAQKKKQEVILEIDKKLGLIWADERRLKQMVVNLLSNAVKFTPENGKLGLEIQGDESENKVFISVWDRGIGISEHSLAQLFQPFVQLDSGLARETTGTGLGLALVAQMARLHGGSVTAVSEPEKGSCFTIVLPWQPVTAMDAETRLKITTGKLHRVDPNATDKPTVLLIEDTHEVTMMIKDYLELAGYEIVTAQDGVEGIAQARLAHPDLILMDIQMPRMDGLEATQKLREELEFKYTPIIALTALAMSGDRERCLEAGMNEYISKPVNLRALVKIIENLLSSREEKTRPQ